MEELQEALLSCSLLLKDFSPAPSVCRTPTSTANMMTESCKPLLQSCILQGRWQHFLLATSQPSMDAPGDCDRATCLHLLGTPMDALHDAFWPANFQPTCSILYLGACSSHIVMILNHLSMMASEAVAINVLAICLTNAHVPLQCRSMTIAGVAFLMGCVWQVAAKRYVALLLVGRIFWGWGWALQISQ